MEAPPQSGGGGSGRLPRAGHAPSSVPSAVPGLKHAFLLLSRGLCPEKAVAVSPADEPSHCPSPLACVHRKAAKERQLPLG